MENRRCLTRRHRADQECTDFGQLRQVSGCALNVAVKLKLLAIFALSGIVHDESGFRRQFRADWCGDLPHAMKSDENPTAE